MNFPTTRWSLIVASGETDAARTAWAELAVNYRSAVHAYFRCRFGVEAAEDLTQSFFAASIDGGWWARADLDRGSFRTYLRMLLRRFGERHVDANAVGRGPDQKIERIADENADPEAAYDRDFAHALVGRALERLRSECAGSDEAKVLLPHVLDRGDQGDLKLMASRLGIASTSLRQRLHRMRLRLRELLREEFAQLVIDPASIDAELIAIQQAMKG